MRLISGSLIIALGATTQVVAQTPRGGTIAGIVRDSAARPISGVDVSARPGGHQARTDSTGRFFITGLDNGTYTVRARKVGYQSENWDVKLSQSQRVDLAIIRDTCSG